MWSKLVDLEMTPEEQEDSGMVSVMSGEKPNGPRYPYGLSISLNKATMEKLGLSLAGCEIGSLLDFRAFGTVTSISANQRNDGTDDCCVCVQLEKMAVEDEMTEDDK